MEMKILIWLILGTDVLTHVMTSPRTHLAFEDPSSICYDSDGTPHDVGPFIDPKDVCNSCTCHKNGHITCEEIDCPMNPPCKKHMRVKLKGQCCPTCQCWYQNRKFKQGPLGDRCDCVCENGRVTCPRAHCPDVQLMCADPKLDENCCPHCPNGHTCATGRKIIEYGKYVKVGHKICTCAGDPWFPNAFCAVRRVGRLLRRKYGKTIVDFSLPGIR